MRQLPLLAAFAFTPLISFAAPALVPLPASLAEKSGPGFELTATTGFTATGPAAQEAGFVAERLRASTGFALPVSASGAGIVFRLDPTLKTKLGDEGYRLESDAEGVRISAADTAGLFYGGQTLLELLPPEAFSSALVAGKKWTVPAVTIEDEPRFAWRGFMLDESRHFIGASHVKRLLDAMALHKLNRFHWHLTDDEGWRIEIKAYPKLTDIGAWRGTECRLPNTLGEKYKRYGGFYTQDELRDIVAYAKARHIEIMPEVDLPGHSLATVTAYPELLAGGKSDTVSAQGFTSNVISPAKPATYRFVETVFDELKGIFPYEYIHIGGDEVNHGAWKDSPEISALMKAEKLQSLHDVQVFFTKRLEGIFARRGKKIFGWNEVFDERLDKNTGIMAWTGTGPGYHAAKKGYPVVMAPGQHAYLDMGYPGAQGEPPSHWWAGPVDNARVYAFDPLGDGGDLPQSAKGRILGVEAALWTEYVVPWKGEALDLETFSAHADYKTWPRLSALAEVGWTPQALRVYDDFEKRLGPDQLRRLGLLGVEVPDLHAAIRHREGRRRHHPRTLPPCRDPLHAGRHAAGRRFPSLRGLLRPEGTRARPPARAHLPRRTRRNGPGGREPGEHRRMVAKIGEKGVFEHRIQPDRHARLRRHLAGHFRENRRPERHARTPCGAPRGRRAGSRRRARWSRGRRQQGAHLPFRRARFRQGRQGDAARRACR